MQIDADVDSGISYIQPGETPQNHFPTTPTCRTLRPPVMPDPPDAGDGGFSSCPDPNAPCCASDHDCVDGGAGKTNGRCVHIFYTECNWDGCVTSSDCASDQSCICASDDPSDMNRCAPSNCRSDADCGSGGYCSPTVSACFGGGVDGIYCHTPDDKCLNDSDCAALPVQKGE
ncbi:MAG: hypothetical protein ACRELY_28050, partial [Polyangiaceae bacterium]